MSTTDKKSRPSRRTNGLPARLNEIPPEEARAEGLVVVVDSSKKVKILNYFLQ